MPGGKERRRKAAREEFCGAAREPRNATLVQEEAGFWQTNWKGQNSHRGL
jgi:hypothetical protein